MGSVAFSVDNRQIVSGSRDGTIRLWNTLGECKYAISGNDAESQGHTAWVSCVRFSPSQSVPLIVSSGWDKLVKVWDLNEGKRLYSLDAGEIIHGLVFSPNRYWLCAATEDSIKIWDLESKVVVDTLRPEEPEFGRMPACTCLAWSADE